MRSVVWIRRSVLSGALAALTACGGGSDVAPVTPASDPAPGVVRRPVGAAPGGTTAAVVDVVLGYTNGFVTLHGGVEPARARLQALVDTTNQAYARSGIVHRIRLAGSLQVNYTDRNTQVAALEALTGQRCDSAGCVPTVVPTELMPLRTAREQLGADLVALVRPLQQPEQLACGHAWLLGAGGVPIADTDAPRGYAVLSDGSDVDETDGRTYTCKDTQLSHELGHNMGQAHNIEDSPGAGTHPYAYGYREPTDTGFYTIMAVPTGPGSRQVPIGYFANPDVNDPLTGRPTGTSTANNAASLHITMPLVARFRASVLGN